MLLRNVPQLVFRINVVIAGVDAAIVLHGYALAAELAIYAQLRISTHPLRHSSLEQIDVHLAVVAAVPVMPDLAEEVVPVVRVEPTSP